MEPDRATRVEVGLDGILIGAAEGWGPRGSAKSDSDVVKPLEAEAELEGNGE